jgi:hypothetical protein
VTRSPLAYTELVRSASRRAFVVAVVLAASLVTRVAPARVDAPILDHPTLFADLEALADPALQGRQTGSAGGVAARHHIANAFRAIGLRPAGTSGYLQPFSFSMRRFGAILGPGPFRRTYHDAANVVGRLEGTDPVKRPIVVSAHYDHLGVIDGVVYPGADDNASGVAGLLAVARAMKSRTHRHPLVFVAFDAEELNLRGAKAFVRGAGHQGFALNVNLDMISRSADNEIYVAGTSHSPSLRPPLEPLQSRTAATIRFGHDTPELGTGDWTMLSDHGAFHEVGVPFVYFGVEDHEDYHRPTDTLDRVDRRFFADVTALVIEAVMALDRVIH